MAATFPALSHFAIPEQHIMCRLKASKMPVCSHCDNYPCDWERYGPKLLSTGNRRIDNGYTNPGARYACYQAYTHFVHGNLGAGNRREIPSCVMVGIKSAFPSATYTGYRPGEDDSVVSMTDFCSKISIDHQDRPLESFIPGGSKAEGQRAFFGKRCWGR